MEKWVKEMKWEKEWLERQLRQLGVKVFPTETNFSVFRLPNQYDSKKIQKEIAEKGIVVRDRSTLPLMENCIRVTVGTEAENERFVRTLRGVMKL
jgi:histidinol-phosphate aminotransferase